MRILRLLLATMVLIAPPARAAEESRALFVPAGHAESRLLERARRHVARGETAQALAVFDQLFTLQPDFASAITERAFLRETLGDFAGAKVDYDRVLELAPLRENSWSHAAWIRALLNEDLEGASRRCDRALAIGRSLDAVDSCGFVAFQRGDFAGALALYDEALRLSPRSDTSRYMRGLTRLRLGREAEGRADIAKALKSAPSLADLWTRRGAPPP
jgi:tetratricopeptide (TPR) repeat protein